MANFSIYILKIIIIIPLKNYISGMFFLPLFTNDINFDDLIIFINNNFARIDVYLNFDLKICSWAM